ncbi:MAG: hypothetical protein EOO09_14000 [Chitinophagaceae bacterium]|nr:MAG: hypothetical protein EOO09_14000 [Chitinophagaceae bacterium]
MKLLFGLLLAAITLPASAQKDDLKAVHADGKLSTGSLDIVGVDQFGRTIETVAGYKPKKQVGIFYWPWIGQPYATGVYDATKIAAMPDGLKLLYDLKSPDKETSPTGQAHFWGEPLFGYYNSADEWVIRRQMKMLTLAGIDFIAFDLTNRVTYKEVYDKVFRIIEEFQQQGWKAPKAVFYTHSKSMETTQVLYDDLYKPRRYENAWYKVDGKPMIIAYTDPADDLAEAKSRSDNGYTPKPFSKEILDFFYFKKPQWPFDPTYQNGFPWVEWSFPQPLHGSVMSVSVASHPKVPMSRSITSGWVNWGRGWDPDKKENIAADVDKGAFFQRQWDNAIRVDPDTVFVGGWNEWIAYKQPYGDEYMLCDAANREYSRDVEPMRDGYEDAFYVQLIKNIRRYKGVAAESRSSAGTRTYRNVDAIPFARNSPGATDKITYRQAAPVNVLDEIKLSSDKESVVFEIKALEAFKPAAAGTGALEIYLGSGTPSLKGWKGYEYLLRQDPASGTFSVNQLDADYQMKVIGKAAYTVSGNRIVVKLSRKDLGLTGNTKTIYFKVADGLAKPGDLMDSYLSGSVMPMGRLSYQYPIK